MAAQFNRTRWCLDKNGPSWLNSWHKLEIESLQRLQVSRKRQTSALWTVACTVDSGIAVTTWLGNGAISPRTFSSSVAATRDITSGLRRKDSTGNSLVLQLVSTPHTNRVLKVRQGVLTTISIKKAEIRDKAYATIGDKSVTFELTNSSFGQCCAALRSRIQQYLHIV